MITTISPHQFTTVLQALTDPETIYVVPSFQRPYAWETDQIKDLLRDMAKAAARSEGSHYLAAIHLIPLDLARADDPLTEFVAKKIIAIAQTGVRDPVILAHLAISEFGFSEQQ